jgi:ATP-binding cassette subfamily B protein
MFLVVSFVAAASRLALLYFTNKIGFRIGADLGLLVYRQSLLQPLESQKARSSAEIIAAASEKSHVIVYNVIVAVLQFCGSSIVFLSIAAALFVFNPWITMGTLLFFSGFYLMIVWGFRGEIARASKDVASFQTKVFRALQEGLGSKRDVILHKAQDYYCNMYRNAVIPLRSAQGNIQFAIQGPRFIIESAVVMLIGGIFLILNNLSTNISAVLPVLGVFALGGLKLLPITQQIYASSTAIISSREVMRDVLGNIPEYARTTAIRESGLPRAPIEFSQTLKLVAVSFSYQGASTDALSGVSMTIEKGERIAIIGPSGGGKSTLADVLLGLLSPSEGYLAIDDSRIDEKNVAEWHALVAHVPQDIYLADSTITENIAIATPSDKIDLDQVRKAAALARISDLIDSLPEGYGFMVGEGGNRLSGGQRQRIAIARALYRGAQFLVLDEATSALDRDLENELLATIHDISRDITIVMVTHNLESTNEFDRVFSMNAGTLTHVARMHP